MSYVIDGFTCSEVLQEALKLLQKEHQEIEKYKISPQYNSVIYNARIYKTEQLYNKIQEAHNLLETAMLKASAEISKIKLENKPPQSDYKKTYSDSYFMSNDSKENLRRHLIAEQRIIDNID